jgi:hypothetical protein
MSGELLSRTARPPRWDSGTLESLSEEPRMIRVTFSLQLPGNNRHRANKRIAFEINRT